MRIGLQIGATPGPESSVVGLIEHARRLEARGFASMWMAQIFGLDALGALGIVASHTQRIELGTAVVPVHPRHPMVMAQQALTVQSASQGRFTLGVGLSHQIVIEGMFGFSYEKPGRYMREYLQVLAPLLRGEPVDFEGERLRGHGGLQVPGARPVPIIVAALGPVMLRLTGQLADGTMTWMVGPATLESHTIPTIRTAAREAGRSEPRIVAGFPLAVTDDPEAAREKIARLLQVYGTLPSYRAMLERERVRDPVDVALLGDEPTLERQLARLRDIGVTDFQAAIVEVEDGEAERALDFLAAQIPVRRPG
jgi:F420-dependent oxidoreductase-like protein